VDPRPGIDPVDPVVVPVEIEDIDELTAPELEDLLQPAGRGPEVLIVDLSRVQFMSSTGIRILVMAWRRAQLMGGDLVITGCSDLVARVLRICGVDKLITCYPSVTDARRALTVSAS